VRPAAKAGYNPTFELANWTSQAPEFEDLTRLAS